MSLEELSDGQRTPASVSTTETVVPSPDRLSLKDHLPERSEKDFGFLPIPKNVRYDPQKPPHFGLLMNAMFGITGSFIVANLYYCQPLLIQYSVSFGVTYHEVSNIPTLMQAGYAIGLLLISPLGDLVRRRPLILLLVFINASLTIGLAFTSNLVVFEILSFIIGICNVVPQILMPLAADLAPPERRASALSIVLSGFLFGVLVARVLAGVVAQFVSWRVVYYIAIGVQYLILTVMYWGLPDYPAKNTNISYFKILYTMAKFTVTEPLLVQGILITLAASAIFQNFWVTLTFLLAEPPYNYSTLVIGLFGLVGMAGVAMAPLIGRMVDGLVPWSATLIGTVALLLTFVLQTAAVGRSVAVVIIVCLALDVFRQSQQVSITSGVLGLDASARSRLNAVILLAFFIGSVMGTAVGSKVFIQYGWRANAALNLAWVGWTLFVLFLRGPHCPRYTWIGWQGGFELRKSRVLEQQRREREASAESEEEKRTSDSDRSGGGATGGGEIVEDPSGRKGDQNPNPGRTSAMSDSDARDATDEKKGGSMV